MKVNIEIDEQQLKRLIIDYLERTLGDIELDPKALKIEVKSAQNYKSEWESANFRAVYNQYIL